MSIQDTVRRGVFPQWEALVLVSVIWMISPQAVSAASARSRIPLPLRTAPAQTQIATAYHLAHQDTHYPYEPTGWGQIAWPSAQVGWAWTTNSAGISGIAHTTNGGMTWHWWRNQRSTGQTVYWTQLRTRGPDRVWFLGEAGSGAFWVFLHTTNGGASWTRWTVQPPPGAEIYGNVIAVFPHTGFQALGVFEDHQFWWGPSDGWNTAWPSSTRITAVATMPGAGEAVAFKTHVGATELRVITVRSTEQVTTTPSIPMPSLITGMDWLNAREGWIWSRSHVWRTTNGGRTWQALGRLPGWPRDPGVTLYMTSQAQGYAAVGRNGLGNGPWWEATKLFHTANGGRSWTRVILPTITYSRPALLRLGGFYVAGMHDQTITLWYGPIAFDGGLPQRIWSDNGGATWHRAQHDPNEPV